MNHPNKEEVMANLQDKNPYEVEVVKVIRIVTRIGDGTQENPVRLVEHYYDENAKPLFEIENWLSRYRWI